jgi:predicted lipid-binding transport protein (Tim44 family)
MSMTWNRLRGVMAALAVFTALILLAGDVEARIGGGKSFGSRGSRTFSAPPATQTAPRPASPMERSMTQPAQPRPAAAGTATAGQQAGGGLLGRPGFMGGLFAGFLGAGLLGMLFGHGLFGGLGAGFASMLGLILQIALIVIVARLLWAWWQRRNAPGYATASGPSLRDMNAAAPGNAARATSGGGGTFPAGGEVAINEADYNAFERLLGDVQAAFSAEDLGKLRALVTPEMLSYFAEQLAENASRGVVNEVSDIKLEQGDLSEAWREGATDYATVAMRFSMIDRTHDRATGKMVEGSDARQEATELWTFLRAPGGKWILSAIQQA